MTNTNIVSHTFNDTLVEQRTSDGFINATASAAANGKQVRDWLKTEPTYDLLLALNEESGIETEEDYKLNSSVSRLSAFFPNFLAVKQGSPEFGGGTRIGGHPQESQC